MINASRPRSQQPASLLPSHHDLYRHKRERGGEQAKSPRGSGALILGPFTSAGTLLASPDTSAAASSPNANPAPARPGPAPRRHGHRSVPRRSRAEVRQRPPFDQPGGGVDGRGRRHDHQQRRLRERLAGRRDQGACPHGQRRRGAAGRVPPPRRGGVGSSGGRHQRQRQRLLRLQRRLFLRDGRR